ncbi:MAG TPA: PQQ-dependent sugar dehydrogenase [Pyrinomonadaceae bacterium]
MTSHSSHPSDGAASALKRERLNALKLVRPSIVLLTALLCALMVQPALYGATLPSGFTETQLAVGLSNPTAMAFAPDGRLFVCQQGGQVRVIKNGSLLAAPFLSVTVNSQGERGLLGIAFDPDFNSNHFVYVYYTATTPAVHNRVSRFTASGDTAVGGSEVVILELNNLSGATNHNGGAMHFGPDGKLYIAVGENATPSNAQTLSNLLGKMLRINSNGTIPTDNPFFNTAAGNNRAIWALGLRNPYTFAFQPGTGRLFINDVGQNTWEEINEGIAGANYGWPICEGACNNSSFRNPFYFYANDGQTCAITGGTFYNPAVVQFPSDYVGKYFFADFCAGWIKRIDPANGAVADFATGIWSPVDLLIGPDGSLYYLARGSEAVFKVQYPANLPSANTFQFNAPTYNASEGAGSVNITVTRLGDTSTAATIDYAASNGTASDRSDYTTALGTLSFAPGETSKPLTILLTDDLYLEENETVDLALSNPSTGMTLGSQNQATLTIGDNDAAQPTSNPADQSQFFVQQHYHDFLNREPDAGGLAYWTNEINKCGSDATCIHNRRIAVSAAFFIEVEFQETGFFVYRFYKASFARRPTYAEFMRDRSHLVVGPNLAADKLAYALEFVRRSEFTVKYPLTLSGTDFVDALLQTVKNSSALDLASRRSELLAEYNAGSNQSESRARVVRKLIEYPEYAQAEYNRGFVLAEYFSYLRRDPDEGGYLFWLDVLNNKVPNNYRSMVCAFITSTEYQQRFSPIITHSNRECGP